MLQRCPCSSTDTIDSTIGLRFGQRHTSVSADAWGSSQGGGASSGSDASEPYRSRELHEACGTRRVQRVANEASGGLGEALHRPDSPQRQRAERSLRSRFFNSIAKFVGGSDSIAKFVGESDRSFTTSQDDFSGEV
jgi:hypothetical protein